MRQNETQLFRERAQQLVNTEQKIFSLMQKAGQQADQALLGEGMPSVIPVTLPAALAAGLLAAAVILRENGTAVIVLVLALLFMLGKVYSNWQNYSMRKNALHKSGTFAGQAKELEKKRAGLIAELNRMRSSADTGRYWWDVGLNPALLPKMPGQMLPAGDKWLFGVFHELKLETKKDGIYLHDFLKEPVLYRAEWVEALRTGKTAELYRDDAVYSSGAAAYICRHLYAYHMTPIEEIESHTTVQKVDRERVLQEYRSKVDDIERTVNTLLNGDYLTNQTRYMAGRMSFFDYDEADTYRRLAEYDFKEKIPDEIRHTHYSQSFNLLWYMEFLSCATVFIAADGPRAGQTALILMPVEKQDSIGFTVRTRSADEFCGYLESYIGLEPLEVGATRIRPSLAAFAGTLFGSHYRQYLRLRRRDVLAEKPRGLTDEEWVYLIRKDG